MTNDLIKRWRGVALEEEKMAKGTMLILGSSRNGGTSIGFSLISGEREG